MVNREIFDYEASIWTLQDGFISILKPSGTETKGQIQNGKVNIKDDGTRTLTFSIPMYVYEDGIKKENPAWYNTTNGNLIVNLRKIKIIFNKKQETEKVFEFLITKISEEHQGNILTCNVECEGLAFNELGKIGYQISLSEELYYEEYNQWYNKLNDFINAKSTIDRLESSDFRTPIYNSYFSNGEIVHNENYNLSIIEFEAPKRMRISNIQISNGTNSSGILTKLLYHNLSLNRYVVVSNLSEITTDRLVIVHETENNYHPENAYFLSAEVEFFAYTNEEITNFKKTEPLNNINYWCDKIMPYVPKWTYEIQMNWDGYYFGTFNSIENKYSKRDSNKIYEDAIEALGPNKEKLRLLEVEESNVYNITQTIAELFGVFCRYEYEYDQNYHIVGRKIIFYNNFIKEEEGVYDLTYPYSAAEVKREIDSLNTITKLYVRPVEDESLPTGLIDIMDVDINKTKENYILNFDYLHDIHTINDEQYQAVGEYEDKIRELNEKIIPIESAIISLQGQKTDIESKVTFYNNAIAQDKKCISDNNAEYLNNLHSLTGEYNIRTPLLAVLKKNKENFQDVNGYHYHIDLTQKGIDAATIQIYLLYMGTSAQQGEGYDFTLSAPINAGQKFEYDEYGEIIGINDIIITNTDIQSVNNILNLSQENTKHVENLDGTYIYLTFNYNLQTYYDRIDYIWTTRLINDTNKYTSYKEQLQILTKNLNHLLDTQKVLLDEKKETIFNFNKLMGPALREGYWQPEKYTDYSDRYNNYYYFSPSDRIYDSDSGLGTNKSHLDELIWDDIPFEEEQLLTYKTGISENEVYYPCIELDMPGIREIFNPEKIKENNIDINDLCFFYYNYNFNNANIENDPKNKLSSFRVGSQCEFGFLKTTSYLIDPLSGQPLPRIYVTPVLILTGAKNISETNWASIMGHKMYLGKMEVKENGEIGLTEWSKEVSSNDFVQIQTQTLTYPRIKINSLSLKDNEDELLISYMGQQLKKYEDYSVLLRTNEVEIEEITESDIQEEIYTKFTKEITANYITIKPSVLLAAGFTLDNYNNSTTKNIIDITYALSLTNKTVYLDALLVAKENAYPKISYSVKPSMFNIDFIKTLYNRLNQIVHINDSDLHFNHVQGYISEMEIDLDHIWESTVEVKNYKNKFEDLFSTIVAQTEEMKKNGTVIDGISKIITGGTISGTALKTALIKVDFDYAFNNGKLTISEDGIYGTSDAGMVAFRGGGIFLADSRDADGNWQWHTGIVPQGINANLITAGQLDTNRVMIYAGDKLSFQINSEGIFAYKSFFDDTKQANIQIGEGFDVQRVNQMLANGSGIDSRQFAKMDNNGFFLTVKKDALVATHPLIQETLEEDLSIVNYIIIGDKYYDYVLDENSGKYNLIGHDENEEGYAEKIAAIPDQFDRVSISWNGFTLRNYNGEKTLYMDPDSGNLYFNGVINFDNTYFENGDGTLTNVGTTIDNSIQDIVQNLINENQQVGLKIEAKVDYMNGIFTETLNEAQGLLNGAFGKIQEIGELVDDLNEDFMDSINYANDLLDQVPLRLAEIDDHVNELNNDFIETLGYANELLDQVPLRLAEIDDHVNDLNNSFIETLGYANELLDNVPLRLAEIDDRVNVLNETFLNELNEAKELIDQVPLNLENINNKVDLLNADFMDSLDKANELLDGVQGNIDKLNDTIINLSAEFNFELDETEKLLTEEIDNKFSGMDDKIDTAVNTYLGGHTNLSTLINQADTIIAQINAAGEDFISHVYEGSSNPDVPYKVGDIWKKSNTEVYVAKNSKSEGTYNSNDWIPISKGLRSAQMIVDTEQGYIDLFTVNQSQNISRIFIGGNDNDSKKGIELGSSYPIKILSAEATGGSLVNISSEGIDLASTNKISFYSSDIGATNSKSAMEISKDRILFGVQEKASSSVFELDKTGIVLSSAGLIGESGNVVVNSSDVNLLKITGLQITETNIGMAVQANNNNKNLFWMDKDGFELGSWNNNGTSYDTTVDSAKLKKSVGSYAILGRDKGFEIGTKFIQAGKTGASTSASVFRINSGEVRVGALANGSISTFNVNGTGLIFATRPQDNNDTAPVDNAYTADTNLRTVSGMRIKKDSIGMSILTSANNGSVFWMDENGVEIGSINSSTSTSGVQKLNLNAGSYVLIKREKGVEIGTQDATSTTITSIRPERVIIANRLESSIDNGEAYLYYPVSAMDIKNDRLVFVSGYSYGNTIGKNFANTNFYTKKLNEFNPRNDIMSGFRITSTNLGMAITNQTEQDPKGTTKSLFWLDQNGIEMGTTGTSATQSNLLKGSYVFIKHSQGVEIGTTENNLTSVVSIRPKKVIVANSVSGSSKAVASIGDEKIVLACGSTANVFNNFSDSGVVNTANNFNPQITTISGFRVTKNDLGFAVTDQNDKKSLIWMDTDGIELGSVQGKTKDENNKDIIDASSNRLLNGSYVFIKHANGVEIGSGGDDSNGSVFSIRQNRAIIASRENATTTALDIQPGTIVLTTGNLTIDQNFINNNNNNSTITGATNNFDPISSSLVGLRIQNTDFGMSTTITNGDGSKKNLFWMDGESIQIGRISTSNSYKKDNLSTYITNGSYILLKHQKGVEIGTQDSDNNPSIVSIQPLNILIATRTEKIDQWYTASASNSVAGYTISAFNIKPNKIILTNGLTIYDIKKDFNNTNDNIKHYIESFNPAYTTSTAITRRSPNFRLSGMRITEQNIGLSITKFDTNDNPIKKNLFWVDENGIELGSLNITYSSPTSTYAKIERDNNTAAISTTAGSYLLLKHSEGIEFGAGYSETNKDAAVVSVRNSRICLAARTSDGNNTYATSAVDIQGGQVVIAIVDKQKPSNSLIKIDKKFETSQGGALQLARDFNPLTQNISGIRIRPTDIGFAVTAKNNNNEYTKQLVYMDANGLKMGSVIGDTNGTGDLSNINNFVYGKGSYVYINHSNGVEIGSCFTDYTEQALSSVTSISKDRTIIASGTVSESGSNYIYNTSATRISGDKIVIISGLDEAISANFSDIDMAYNFSPETSNLGGVLIQNNAIGLSVSNNEKLKKTLIWMDEDGLEIGSVTRTTASGTYSHSTGAKAINLANAFVLIKPNNVIDKNNNTIYGGVTIGSGNNQNANRIALTNNGNINAIAGTLDKNNTSSVPNYTAFNLGVGTDNLSGFELETTARITIGKRIGQGLVRDGETLVRYPFSFITSHSDSVTTASSIMAFRYWDSTISGPTYHKNYISHGSLEFSIIMNSSSSTRNVLTLASTSIGGTTSELFTLTGTGYITSYIRPVQPKSGTNNLLNSTNAGTTGRAELRDTIDQYELNSDKSVKSLILASGAVLNFKQPTADLTSATLNMSADGAIVKVNVSAGSTKLPSEPRILGKLAFDNTNSYSVNSKIQFNFSSDSNSALTINGTDKASILLTNYWYFAQIKFCNIDTERFGDTSILEANSVNANTFTVDANYPIIGKAITTSQNTNSYSQYTYSNHAIYRYKLPSSGTYMIYYEPNPDYKTKIIGDKTWYFPYICYYKGSAYRSITNCVQKVEGIQYLYVNKDSSGRFAIKKLIIYKVNSMNDFSSVTLAENDTDELIRIEGNNDAVGRLRLIYYNNGTAPSRNDYIAVTSDIDGNSSTPNKRDSNEKIYAKSNLEQYWNAARKDLNSNNLKIIDTGDSTSNPDTSKTGRITVDDTQINKQYWIFKAASSTSSSSNSTNNRTDTINFYLGGVQNSFALADYWDAAQNNVRINSITTGQMTKNLYYTGTITLSNNKIETFDIKQGRMNSYGNFVSSTDYTQSDFIRFSYNNDYTLMSLSDYWNAAKKDATVSFISNIDTNQPEKVTAQNTSNNNKKIDAYLHLTYSTRDSTIFDDTSNIIVSSHEGNEPLIQNDTLDGTIYGRIKLNGYWDYARENIYYNRDLFEERNTKLFTLKGIYTADQIKELGTYSERANVSVDSWEPRTDTRSFGPGLGDYWSSTSTIYRYDLGTTCKCYIKYVDSNKYTGYGRVAYSNGNSETLSGTTIVPLKQSGVLTENTRYIYIQTIGSSRTMTVNSITIYVLNI